MTSRPRSVADGNRERAGVAPLHVSLSHSDLTAAAFVVGSSKDNLAR